MIHAFEPVPLSFQLLKTNVKNMKRARETGFYPFYFNQANDGAFSLLPSNHLPECPYQDTEIEVFCKNLDE